MKILFVFHEADITGATLVLFNSVKWYSEHTDMNMTFLLKDDGVLNSEISKIGPVHLWVQEVATKHTVFQRVLRKFFSKKTPQQKLLQHLREQEFDIIYANTIVSSSLIKKMSGFKAKIIWHIHELELAINAIGKYNLDSIKYVDSFVANSQSTKNNLLNYGIDNSSIYVNYPSINLKKIEGAVLPYSVKEHFKIPEDAFIIGSSGSATVRKGILSFIELPIIMDCLLPNNNFYYVWVGKVYDKEVIDYDIENAGISKKIIFVGEQRDPFPYYKIFDIFVSCSKQESFGLSAMEAAALKKPLVCFKGTAGIQEIVEEAKNITVPYLNLIEMAKEIIAVSKDHNKLQELGNNAFETSKKYDIDVIMPLMYNYLKSIKNHN